MSGFQQLLRTSSHKISLQADCEHKKKRESFFPYKE